MSKDEDLRFWASRRLPRRRILRGAAFGIAGLSLAGCGTATVSPTSSPPPTTGAAPAASNATAAPSPAAAPKVGGTLRTMTTAVERNLEPHVAGGVNATGNAGPLICYSQLLTYKWGPDVKPPSYLVAGDLAESWQQADDLTYVFKLRPGVKWHNITPVSGRELVAEDVVYSYNRVREQKSYAAFLAGVVKMEAPDKATLKLTLDKPNTDLLNNLGQNTLPIVARERVERTDGKLDEAPLIGTGPFIFDSFTPNQRFTANRNPDYFLQGKPYIGEFESLRTSDPSSVFNAIRSGAINAYLSGVSVQAAEDIKKAVPLATVIYLPADRNPPEMILNTQIEMFRDVRVRQAISKAIDRKAIIDTVWLGRGRLNAGLSLPDPSYALPEAELGRLFARDLEGARRLLKEAGKEQGFNFEIVCPTGLSGAWISLSELVQANLKDIGIGVTIKPGDTATWAAAQSSGNFQVTTGTFGGAAPNGWLYTRYYSGGGQNWSKYSDPEMDRLIDQQAVMAKDPEGRKKILQDIQHKIINDAVYIPLLMYDAPIVTLPELKGYYPPIGPTSHNAAWVDAWFDK
jgi:peptide/nickel transport system substrate-binding protein